MECQDDDKGQRYVQQQSHRSVYRMRFFQNHNSLKFTPNVMLR